MKKIGKILILFCAVSFAVSKANAQLSISISANIAPPAMPVYVQPACPTDGYMWQPGYWAYDDNDGYYWVPGVWVAAPQPGYLWTPSYWGYAGGSYGFHPGYWGLHVGYYGGINYGFGYGGWGYGGGNWEGGHFRYNTAVVNVNTTVIRNTYVDRTVINNTYVNNHTSFNGPGGVTARPRPEEVSAMHEQHIQPTAQQMSHEQNAGKDRSQFASVNNGHPAAAAMNRVGGRPFNEQGHVATTSTLGRGGNAPGAATPQAIKPAANPGLQHAQPQAQQRAVTPQANKPVGNPGLQHAQAQQQRTPVQQHVRPQGQPRAPRTPNRPQQPKPQPEKHQK